MPGLCVRAFALVAASSSVACAQLRQWTGVSGLWDSPLNWTTTNVPDTVGETALLSGTSAYTSTLNIGGTNTLGRLFFTNPNATLGIRPGSRLLIDQSTNSFSSSTNEGRIALSSNSTAIGQVEIVSRSNGPSSIGSNTGTGVIDLDQSRNASLSMPMFVTGGLRVTNSSGHTIAGNGWISLESDEFVNNGIIEANDDRLELLVSTKSGSTLSNNGALFASGQAVLTLDATVVQGASGAILGEDDATIRLEGSVTDGAIDAADDSSTATTGQLTLRDVSVSGDFTADHELTLQGAFLDNDGTITKTDTADDPSDWNVIAAGTLEFRGNGTFNLARDSELRIFNGQSQQITNAASHTIQGEGEIFADIINHGTIRSTGPARALQLTSDLISQSNTGVIDTDQYFVFPQPRTTTLTTITGGDIIGRTVGDATGYISVSQQLALDSVDINGAQIRLTAGDELFLTDVFFQESTAGEPYLVFSGDLPITVFVDGDLSNNGLINLATEVDGTNTVLLIRESMTLDGFGELVGDFGLKSVIRSEDPGDLLTNGPDHTIRGGVVLEAAVFNFGTITAEGTANNDVITLNTLDKSNFGLINAVDDANILITDVVINQGQSGTIEIHDGTIFFVSQFAPPTIIGGTIQSSGIGRFQVERTSTGSLTGVTLKANSLVRGLVIIDDGLTHDGEMLVTRVSQTDDPGTLRFRNTATLGGTGSIEFQSAAGNSNGLLITDPGTTLTIGPGQTITGAPRLQGAFVFEGTLDPSGGNVVAELSGPFFSFRPGSALILTAGATVSGPFNESIARPYNDTNIALAGDLVVNVSGEQLLDAGDEFILIAPGAPVSGTFDTVTINGVDTPDFPGFDVVYETDNVKLVVRGTGPCNIADLVEPFGVVDLSDIDAFIAAFLSGDNAADIAPPAGIIDLSDVDAFIAAFLQGCP